MNSYAIALDTSFKKGDYYAAIPLYEASIAETKRAQGDFCSALFDPMMKLATCHSILREYDKAILVHEERFMKMSLLYGQTYSLTLSALYSLAQSYYDKGDFQKALSLHETCFTSRSLALGISHKCTETSRFAVSQLKLKLKLGDDGKTRVLHSIDTNQPYKKSPGEAQNPSNSSSSESLFNRMKIMDLIVLIDRRKLNRTGLFDKSDLVHLLVSNIPAVEQRGVTLKLFRTVMKVALSMNNDTSFWTIARVSAIIIGNHEILNRNCRFGVANPRSTLTFADRCPLIDVLMSRHFDSTCTHPILDISYMEAVGEKANFFLSFAYADNFIDLIDALELYLETNKLSDVSTIFWFDTFINDQWTASIKGFDWWANAFRETVTTIGHTLCFMSPWSNPSYLTRVWCLLEMRYSTRVTLILSCREVFSFQQTLLRDLESIDKSLCRIKVENATSFNPQDRDRIFEVIQSMEGGVDGFNNFVMSLIRNWVTESARSLAIKETDDGSTDVKQLEKLIGAALLLKRQGKLDEAKDMYERCIRMEEKHFGPEHQFTLATINNLATLLLEQGNSSHAKVMYERVVIGYEKIFGPDDLKTLNVLLNLGGTHRRLQDYSGARVLYERVLSGYEKGFGKDDPRTLLAVDNMSVLLQAQGKLSDAELMSKRAVTGYGKTLGLDHRDTLTANMNLGTLLEAQGKLTEAKATYEYVLRMLERTLGCEDIKTLATYNHLGHLYEKLGDTKQAKLMFEKADRQCGF